MNFLLRYLSLTTIHDFKSFALHLIDSCLISSPASFPHLCEAQQPAISPSSALREEKTDRKV